MAELPAVKSKLPLRGQFLFSALFLVFSAVLFSQLPNETRWIEGTALFAQPRFWPAVGIGGMLVFAALHLWRLPRRRLVRADLREGRLWLFALEFVAWFMAYVWAVPLVGYLPCSILFVPLLAYRLGYRKPATLGIGALFAFVVVLVFKAVLEVKIPGAASYDLFPPAFRNFLIVNF